MSRILTLQSLPVAGALSADYYADSTISYEACSTVSFGCE